MIGSEADGKMPEEMRWGGRKNERKDVTMQDVVSYAEIKSRFDGEWILLEDPQTTKSLEVREGRVLWHSKDRDEVYRKARELSPKHSAILYAGSPPKDTVVVL